MADDPAPTVSQRRTSPWPLILALGLVASEVGVALAVLPLAVGGLVVFGGAVAGTLAESRHVDRPWPAMAAIGLLLVAGGLAVAWTQLSGLTFASVAALLETPTGVALRALSIAIAGGVLVVVGVAATTLEAT